MIRAIQNGMLPKHDPTPVDDRQHVPFMISRKRRDIGAAELV